MEFSENYLKEQVQVENKFITNVTSELSLIVWVTIVFMLIILSYFENEYVLQRNINMEYEISISEEINKEISLENMKM